MSNSDFLCSPQAAVMKTLTLKGWRHSSHPLSENLRGGGGGGGGGGGAWDPCIMEG